MRFLNNKYSRRYGELIIVSLLLYLCYRSAAVDITNDEAYSFHNIKQFWLIEFFCTGNSHWLNSVAMSLSITLGFEEVYQLRWFSIACSAIFFIALFLWIKTLKPGYLKFFAITIIFLNPYVLDYLFLARGYSCGLAFESLSLLLFFLDLNNRKTGRAVFALLFAVLSAFANFSFIYYFLAFSVLHIFWFYIKEKVSLLKSRAFYIDLVIIILTLSLLVPAIRVMSKCSNDYIGAGTNNPLELFSTFIHSTLYDTFIISPFILTILSLLLVLFIFPAIFIGLRYFKKHNNSFFFACSLLLAIIFCGMLINVFCFNSVFPYGRSALFLFPLIAINTIYFINYMAIKKIVILSFSFLLLVNFILSINFTSVFDFAEQKQTKAIFEQVEKIGAKNVGISPELFGVFNNYYQLTDHHTFNFNGELIKTLSPKGINKEENYSSRYDHLLLFPPYNLSYYKNAHLKISAVKLFEQNNILLVKVVKE